jgi:tetratricopeptide (TPR) repeat protein
LINANPLNADNYIQRGLLEMKMKNIDLALKDYNKAIVLNPSAGAAYVNRADAYLALKDYDGALKDANKSVELNSKDDNAYMVRGNIKTANKDYKNAIKDYTSGIAINPKNAKLFAYRGLTETYLRNYDLMNQDFNAALSIAPTDEIYNIRGASKMNLNSPTLAVVDFTSAIQNNHNNAQSYLNRGLAKMMLPEYKKDACNDFRIALELGLKAAAEAMATYCK